MAKEKANSNTSGKGKKSVIVFRKSGSQSEVLDFDFFPPPIIDGERETDYQNFRASCINAVKPKDAIEKIWLQDFVDYSWDSHRLRRTKTLLIQITRKQAVETILKQFDDADDVLSSTAWLTAGPMALAWSQSEQEAVAKVEALLEMHDLDIDSIMATAITLKLPELERLDKLIASYDYRRDAAMRELGRRRDSLAKHARDFANDMITDVDVE